VSGLDGVDGRMDQGLVERPPVLLAVDDEVEGEGLLQAHGFSRGYLTEWNLATPRIATHIARSSLVTRHPSLTARHGDGSLAELPPVEIGVEAAPRE